VPVGGRALPLAGAAVNSAETGECHREAIDRLLDAVFYAPVGLLLAGGKSSAELAAQGRRQVEAARMLGRMALGCTAQPPGEDPPDTRESTQDRGDSDGRESTQDRGDSDGRGDTQDSGDSDGRGDEAAGAGAVSAGLGPG